jgi:hypothetical protein
MLPDLLVESLRAVLHGRHFGVIDDEDASCAVQQPGERFSRKPASLHVVTRNV